MGSKSSVVKYNQSLTQLASYAVPFNTYDVAISTGGDIIACGSTGTSATASRTGYVYSIAAGACVPYVMTCCNATVCPVPPLCTNDSPITLDPEVNGGTWSSSAPGFNAATGVFSPSVAGVGTFTFYYTLGCGTDSLTITVSACVAMTVCREANGDLTVSGGTGPYTWSQPVMVVSCVASVGPGCGFFDRTGATNTYTNFTTGTTITPPVGADTVRVTDNTGTVVTSFNILTLPVCSVPLPVSGIKFYGKLKNDETVDLNWETETEINNDYFIVESSPDFNNWKYVGKIKGAGNSESTKSYFLNDKYPFESITYYRLFQTDLNGTTTYLSTIAINNTDNTDLISNLQPNPAQDLVTFTFNGEITNQIFNVFLLNYLGEQVTRISFDDISPATAVSVDVSQLPNGVYLLVGVQGNETVHKKLIITR